MTSSAWPDQTVSEHPVSEHPVPDEAPAAVRLDLVEVAGDLAHREPASSVPDKNEVVPDRHRYTGPELSALLDQVRRELGVEASIMEANRVRSGGFAGFFAKESYEVVAAAPAAATTRRTDPAPTPPPAATQVAPAPAPGSGSPPVGAAPVPRPAPAPAAPLASAPGPRSVPAPVPRSSPAPAALVSAAPVPAVPVPAVPVPRRPPIAPTPAQQQPPPSESNARVQRQPAEISIALLERAEAVSALERAGIGRAPDGAYDLRDRGRTRFADVLEAELVSESTTPPPAEPHVIVAPTPAKAPSSEERASDPPVIVAPRAAEVPTQERPIGLRIEEIDLGPRHDPAPLDIEWAPEPAPLELASPAEAPGVLPTIDDGSIRSEHPGGSLVTIVGSIDAALDLARRVVADPRTCYQDLVVVTPEPAATGMPASRVGRHYEALTKHLYDWTLGDRSGIVVVDAALAARLRAEVVCLRHLGAESVYIVDDRQAPAAHILEQLDGIEGAIVVEASPDLDRVTDVRR